jgi:hypothetical protein
MPGYHAALAKGGAAELAVRAAGRQRHGRALLCEEVQGAVRK